MLLHSFNKALRHRLAVDADSDDDEMVEPTAEAAAGADLLESDLLADTTSGAAACSDRSLLDNMWFGLSVCIQHPARKSTPGCLDVLGYILPTCVCILALPLCHTWLLIQTGLLIQARTTSRGHSRQKPQLVSTI